MKTKRCITLLLTLVLSLGLGVAAMAQNIVKGTVIDQGGQPVVGASIQVLENTSKGTVTDIDGNWSMDVPAGSTLRFSSIGYKDLDVKLGDQKVLNVTMEEDIDVLQDLGQRNTFEDAVLHVLVESGLFEGNQLGTLLGNHRRNTRGTRSS